jgi:hypothetical protein
VKWKPYSVLIILSLLVGGQMLYYAFFVPTITIGGISMRLVLTDEVFYSGYILAFTIALAIIFRGVFWKIMLFLYLCCSLIGIIDFTEWTFSIGIGDLHIRLLPLIFLILHVYLNPDFLPFMKGPVGGAFAEEIVLPTHDDTPEPEKITFFEKKFASKSTGDLLHNIELNELVPEAIIASKNLIEQRK